MKPFLQRSFTHSAPVSSILKLHDVTARDGLQNEKLALSILDKVKLVENIVQYQPAGIEVCSFVRGDRVPNLAGASELCSRLADNPTFSTFKGTVAALVPNMKGFETFLKHKNVLNTVVVLVSCTDSHSKSNVNATMQVAMANTLSIIKVAKQEGVKVRAYASLAFGCPFEGKVPPERVLDLCDTYFQHGADKVLLADTLGVGTPDQVNYFLTKLLANNVKPDQLGLHMHDSHSKAHLNVMEAWKFKVHDFDASVGGCGGCNFAPGSKGNISIENLWRALGMKDEQKWKALRHANFVLSNALQTKLEQ